MSSALCGMMLGLLVGAAGCTSPTRYVRADEPGEPGYRTTRISDDVYRVSFKGNEVTDRETVETYLLYRAAQLARDTGHEWMEIRTGSLEKDIDLRGYNTLMTAPGFYGYPLGYNFVSYPYYASFPLGVYGSRSMISAERSYTAIAYVELHKGQPPNGNANVFNADNVVETLGPQVKLPK